MIPKGDDVKIEPLEGKDMKEKLAKLGQKRNDLLEQFKTQYGRLPECNSENE